jgi:hypothetical protein
MATSRVVKHPLASLTVTVYTPATTLLIGGVVEALDHKYVYGGVPPVGNASAPPSACPQLALVCVSVMVITGGLLITTESVVVHPLASVIVIFQVPEHIANTVAVVLAEGSSHRYV